MGKYFGTDGIRGVAGEELTGALAYRAGLAAGQALAEKLGRKPLVCIGRDTRASGTFLEAALSAGLCAAGADVSLLGVLPTPAVAYLTMSGKADAGAVISASHNPFEHNGIKLFSGAGYKLDDSWEALVERYIDAPPKEKTGGGLGRIAHLEGEGAERYVAHIIKSAPGRLDGLRVLIDCANGAASRTAERIFSALGCDCRVIFCDPDGININTGCGSTHMSALQKQAAAGLFDAGIAFDGDADRCLACDELGRLIDGDRIMALLAARMKSEGTLRGGVAATVMSNLGLRRYLGALSVEMIETKVGDRFVLEEMQSRGFNLGGEQSGHIILSDWATTGDGQLTAAHLLWLIKNSGQPASTLRDAVEIFPQVMLNVPVPTRAKGKVAADPRVQAENERIAAALGGAGRLLIRPSGTEPLVRVMVEGPDQEEITRLAKEAAQVVREVAETL